MRHNKAIMPTPKSTIKPTAASPGPYPDHSFIAAMRAKFLGKGFDALSRDEAIDYINNLSEALHENKKAVNEHAALCAVAEAANMVLSGGNLEFQFTVQKLSKVLAALERVRKEGGV